MSNRKSPKKAVTHWLKHTHLFAALPTGLLLAASVFILLAWAWSQGDYLSWARLCTGWRALSAETDSPHHLELTLALTGLVSLFSLLAIRSRQQASAATRIALTIQHDAEARLVAAVDQLGHSEPQVRIAGVYALADLADTYKGPYRQRVVDILCGYLRTERHQWPHPTSQQHEQKTKGTTAPQGPEPISSDGPVEFVILDVMARHLRKNPPRRWYSRKRVAVQEVDDDQLWCDCAFDLHDATLTEHVPFKHALFSNRTSFQGTQFHGPVSFSHATFRTEASFSSAQFYDRTSFEGTQFQEEASFTSARFCRYASFVKTQFREKAFFSYTEFQEDACFGGAWYHHELPGPRFHKIVHFEGAQFHGRTTFYDAEFHSNANFDNTQFQADLSLEYTSFTGNATFRHAQFREETSFNVWFRGRTSFLDSQFHGRTFFTRTSFSAEASFTDAEFHEETSFNQTSFHSTARFWNTRFHSRVSFDKAEFTMQLKPQEHHTFPDQLPLNKDTGLPLGAKRMQPTEPESPINQERNQDTAVPADTAPSS